MTTDITELAQGRLDFTQPLETESGEPVKHVCHDVIEYKSARVCVDVETGVVYSSPFVGLKIRNVSRNAAVRKFTEEAALAYHEYEQGWISDMKCGDRSHEYLSFVRDPKNILALVEALEKAQKTEKTLESRNRRLDGIITAAEKRIAELESRTVTVKLPLLRRKTADDYVDETFESCDLAAVYNACRLECEVKFKNSLTAQGIKWEAE